MKEQATSWTFPNRTGNVLGHWRWNRRVGNQGCPHGVAWFLSLLSVSASFFSFDLQSNILVSLLLLQFAHGFTLVYADFNLATMLHEFSTQLTSHFPYFNFPGSDICTGPVKLSGQLAWGWGVGSYLNEYAF